MAVIATRHYKIVRPGEVHPTAFNAGDVLPAWAADLAIADGAAAGADEASHAASAPSAAAAAAEPEKSASPVQIVAKTTRACEIDIDGKPTKFRSGVKVYGDTAAALIDAGHAMRLSASDGPTETK